VDPFGQCKTTPLERGSWPRGTDAHRLPVKPGPDHQFKLWAQQSGQTDTDGTLSYALAKPCWSDLEPKLGIYSNPRHRLELENEGQQ
jgi:hypothetical protein